MKLYQLTDVAAGDIIAPHDLNLELRHMLGEINGGLDLENISSVVASKLKPGERMDYLYESGDPARDQDGTAVAFGQKAWRPVEIGSELFARYTLDLRRPCMLTVRAGAYMSFATQKTQHWTLGVFVDGELVCESGTNGFGEIQSRQVAGGLIVPAGRRTIVMAYRIAHEGGLQMTLEAYNLYAKGMYW